MSDSNSKAGTIGFSTGALERGNFARALTWLQDHHIDGVEFSALRFEELEPLVKTLDTINTKQFRYISFHAPSSFPDAAEHRVVQLLGRVAQHGWNIIAHPDVIRTPELWTHFGHQLLVENMDRRKSVGRSVTELDAIFKNLPKARLCLDVAHARQLDTTLTLLSQLISHFASRIAEIHISELDSFCQHRPMSAPAVADYQSLSGKFLKTVPVIIESMLDGSRAVLRMQEWKLAQQAMTLPRRTAVS